MPKTRNTYKEGTKIKSMCRICLTQSNNVMFKLVDQLTGVNYDAETYLEALEKVTFSRVDLNDHYPESICPMCVSFLKMTLEFITQYEKSQKRLQKMFKSDTPAYQSIELDCDSNDDPESKDEDYVTEEIKYDPNDPLKVELIIKDKKFNLNEVLVVENEVEENHDYKGFIKNLGREISATIVSKKENFKESENNISVLKVESDEEESQQIHKSDDENEDEEGEESIKFIVESTDEVADNTNDDNEILNNIKIEHIERQENVEIEEHFTESDSQKTSDNDNLEYIEIDMYDKDAIESLIIDRTKLPDGGGDVSTISTRSTRGKNKEETTDEFFKEAKFPCEICKNVYQSKHSLKSHVKRAHTNRSQKTFTCEICGNVCRTRSAFVNHKLKHFDKQFKCELCDKAYTTKAHLKVHMITHTNKRLYLCNVCGKDFNYANALTYHMRLHTGEKNYHCEYCPKRFRMINSLNRHLRTHTGEKPYKCQYCGRDFSSRGEVVCHEYIHTGYRPYHCKYCKKGFSKTHNLKIHLLSHGGPYHCQFCNKTFIEENILTMHNKISHKDLFREQQTQQGTDEDSPDDTFSNFEGLSQDDSMSQDGNLKIELVEEYSDAEFTGQVEMEMEDNHSE